MSCPFVDYRVITFVVWFCHMKTSSCCRIHLGNVYVGVLHKVYHQLNSLTDSELNSDGLCEGNATDNLSVIKYIK